MPMTTAEPAPAANRGSVLVISVAKKDLVDNPEELAKRATVESYAGVFLGPMSGVASTDEAVWEARKQGGDRFFRASRHSGAATP